MATPRFPVSEVLHTLPRHPSAWEIVDALVPAWADLAFVLVPRSGHLRVEAFAHIDPLQMSTLREFQQHHAPPIDDPVSVSARVFRSGVPELLPPTALAAVQRLIRDEAARAALRALGPRTTLFVPLSDASLGPSPLGVLVTAMSSSGREIDDGDLQLLAELAQALAGRMRV